MPDQPQLAAKIEITGKLAVGANPPASNKFKLVITNQGPTIPRPQDGTRLILYLTGTLGSGEADLFLNDADARLSGTTVPKGWRADWKFSGKGKNTFAVQIYTFNDPVMREGELLTIGFSKITSKTGPGQALLAFGTDLRQPLQPLVIEKGEPQSGIIAFYSDPPAGTQNLPGQDVTLKWRTFRLGNRKLEQVGVTDPLPANFDEDEGSYTASDISVGTSFTLSGYGPPPDDQTIDVTVVNSGWHERKHTIRQGDPGYPQPADEDQATALEGVRKKGLTLEPTEIINANNVRLYGVFRYTFQQRENALLFETDQAFARWNLVDSSVPGQQGSIPEGFSTSPGVYFDDHLWLIGGSQIDPDRTSNVVWKFDPGEGLWENVGPADWSERMGHAVLVFQNKIWVMGGRDSSGNALNDVWTRDASSPKWTRVIAKGKIWAPRCLFRPTVFRNQIWLYGGAKEPFSNELYNDLYVYPSNNSADDWEQLKNTDSINQGPNGRVRAPVASCLQAFNDRICLFGKFRSIQTTDGSEIVEPVAFWLNDREQGTWEPFTTERLEGWGSSNTFSYQVLNFQDRFLIAKALGYDRPNPALKIYVPPSPVPLAAMVKASRR
jgi:Kelch motif